MVKRKKRILISWVLVLMLLLNILPFKTAYAAPGADKTSELTSISAKVSQDGAEISEGGTLTSTKPISVELSFGVPVEGDDPTPENPVKKGDTARFELSSSFKLTSGDYIPLVAAGGIVVGHVQFTTDSVTKMVVAEVIFDGEEEVFDGTSNGVLASFNAEFEYDDDGSAGNEGDHTITMLGKSYIVNVPPAEIEYGVTKSGVVDLADKSITWTVDISASKAGAAIDLGGYQFFDDLATVGEYVSGSFTVDGASATPAEEGSAIRYVFPGGSISPKQITFKTRISDDAYYATAEQSVTNKADLLNSEDVIVKDGQITVKFNPPKWIEKTGKSSEEGSTGVYDPTNRTITWSITANEAGAALNNVVITDVLPDGLTLVSAGWQAWDGSVWSSSTSVTPNASGEYNIGNINSRILLTIVTSVPDVTDPTGVTGVTTYTNSASITWDGLTGPGPGTGGVGVGVGYNAITKSGTADPESQKIHWTVTVDTRGQNIPDLKVYDLLVYGSSTSGFNLGTVSGIPGDVTPTDLTPRYNQKYAGNFVGAGLSITVHPIEQDGKRVADLLEITGLSTSDLNTFTFDSQVVNPNIFAGNTTTTVTNTASLFSANTRLNAATANVNYKNSSLSKEMLRRTAITDPAAGVNEITKNLNEGFDYLDKSVIFRLSINGDGIDLSGAENAAGEQLGEATVTDTLPEGWEFTEIIAGSDYLIFEGTGNSNGVVSANDTVPDTVTGLNAVFSGRTATFTFNPLDKPYVILVKAKPTSGTAEKYFNANQTTTERNTLSLTADKWTAGVTSFQDVTIRSQLLEKSIEAPKAGELRWTVEYKPYDLAQPGTKLEDTLPVGIDLRTDSSGALLLSDDNITVHEMTLNVDGSYTLGAEVELKAGENISYDNKTRVLSFNIPDNEKAYSLSYITDITGEPGEVSNQVSLFGNSGSQETTAWPYVILAADGWASLQRNGWFEITKIDEARNPLAGAEFTLFAMDGETIIRTGTTGSDGTVRFKVIPDGEYILRETAAPGGYTPEDISHSVSVTTEGGTVTTSINGKTGADSNKRTIQNFVQDTVGNLTISKVVAGNAADTAKLFDFTVTLNGADGTYPYIGHGVPDGEIKSGDTISLAHGQSITILGVPKDTTYEVAEADYSGEGYLESSTGETGTIAADATQTAAFTNTRNEIVFESEGNLTISKTAAGSGADTTKKFDFKIVLDEASGTYTYTGLGVPDGEIKSGDTVSLAHGQSITVTGLPEGTKYTVTESDYSGEGYTKTSTGETGTIAASATQTAAFTNTKIAEVPEDETGSLTISKKVTGKFGDKKQAFTFVVDLEDDGTYNYSGSKTGKIKSGQIITLKHGEEIVIEGIPVGTVYKVTEKEADKNGYVTSSTGASGKITALGQKAAFVNTKDSDAKTVDKTKTGKAGKTGKAVKTGDDSFSVIWVGFLGSVLLLSVLVILSNIVKKRRR